MLKSNSKTKIGTTTHYRIVDLNNDKVFFDLAVGDRCELVEGLFVSVISEAGEGLVEIGDELDPKWFKLLSLEGTPVIDVAHIAPGQELKLGDATFVLLKPLQVYVPTRAHLVAARNRASLAKACGVDLLNQRNELRPVLSRKKEAKLLNSRLRLAFFSVGTLLAILTIGLFLGDLSSDEEVKVSASQELRSDPPKSPKRKPKFEESAEEKREELARSEDISKEPSPAPETVKKVMPQKRAPSPLMPQNQIASIRQLISEYSIESRFDPRGARRKLRNLKLRIPQQSFLQGEINAALAELE